MRRKLTNDYQELLIESLKNPEEAIGYLNATLEDGHPQLLLLALRNVAEAQGGLLKLSRSTNLNRANLYKMLSHKGRPEIQSLSKVLNAMGLCLQITQKSSKKIKTKIKKAA